VLTARVPTAEEQQDLDYGRKVAAALAAYDIGQTVVVAGQACVAVEAMEGTDATIARAGAILRTLEAEGEASTLERKLSVVKVAKPAQDMRFDVPVIGVGTIVAMRSAGATCLSIEAGRTLIFDLVTVQQLAADAGIAIVAV
jgi:UDP-2,3-diacylglucosamine hydrolase